MQSADQGHPVPLAPGPSTRFISLDGAMLPTQRARDGHQGWHEGKVGVCACFEPKPPAQCVTDEEIHPSYGALSRRPTFYRACLRMLQVGLDDSCCRHMVLIGDGAR